MKKIQLKSGVTLVIRPTTQFKTLHIAVDFAAPLLTHNVSARALVSYLTAVSARNYPDQQAVAQKTIDLYGAQYQTDVLRFGQTHHVRYSLQLPAPTYIDQAEHLLGDAFAFLRDMIFDPLVTPQQFDQATFDKEQQSLINELASISDDKRRYAMLKLRELSYSEPAMQRSSSGDVSGVEQLTAATAYAAYQNMKTSDAISIVVFGDIDEARVRAELEKWPLTARRATMLQPFYRQGLRPQTVEQTERQADINQAILTLSYQLRLTPDDPKRFTALVFNALFGGSPVSKLFTEIREKESLAYSIYSRWQHDTGFLTVAAGLAADQVAETDRLIQVQLQAIQAGNFSAATLAAVKASLINDYLSQQDSPNSDIELVFSRLLTNRQTHVSEWVAAITAVTPADVAALADQVKLQGRFTLMPEAEE